MAQTIISKYLDQLCTVLQEIDHASIERTIEVLLEAYKQNRQVFILGNGGSASTASHMQCDLAKGTAVDGRRRMRVLSLTDNVALMTAISNDVSYERVFTDQLCVLLEAGDVVIGITASGNSPNVLNAIEFAREKNATTVGFIGFGGGKLKDLVDVDVTIASQNYGHCEDVHLILNHLVSQALRQTIESL